MSQRVLDGLEGIGATGFEALPVRIEQVQSRALRVLPEPRYYYLDVGGRIDIDYQASGQGEVRRCPRCQGNLSDKVVEPTRYVPVPGSWDGSDLFKIGPRPMWGMLFCTRRVLELARRDRWSNFRFEPLDVVQRHTAAWDGIDYLGQAWPPSRWYPDAPSAGKTLDEWLEQMRSTDREQARLARVAITDIGAPAVPILAAILNDPSEGWQRDAARMLYFISKRHPLSTEIKKRARLLLPPEIASAWEIITE